MSAAANSRAEGTSPAYARKTQCTRPALAGITGAIREWMVAMIFELSKQPGPQTGKQAALADANESMTTRATRIVSLFELDPELFDGLESAEAERAAALALAPVAILRPGVGEPWASVESSATEFGVLVLSGLLTRDTSLLGRTSMDLVGAGDILRPWDDASESPSVPTRVRWNVHRTARLALLDRGFAERMAPWPSVTATLLSRALRRARWLERHMAILENPRVDARLLLLFWQLADRWGRVGPTGVTVPLRLTHNMLGRLVRAQRPTVTASLRELSDRGLLVRELAGSWVLQGGDAHVQLQLLLGS
jgi:CRP/FNR family transcriptional regulator, cyclic AMP receptor protein